MRKFITSESVCKGHPDKLCDLISDSILDECLSKDRMSRVACECMATKGRIFVAGEVTCSVRINVRAVVRRVLQEVGYDPEKYRIYVYMHQQSPDIAGGVDDALETRNTEIKDIGAGDQGTVYGYATDETADYLPLSLSLAHGICNLLDKCMRDGTIIGIGPDGKAQVTVEDVDGKPRKISTIIVSVQHDERKNLKVLRDEIIREVIMPTLGSLPMDNIEILVNPSGRFVEGGPEADTGLTGRKIIVDTYGGQAAHGGGAFSGKDPTKVDRSAAYMARAIAKNIVKAEYAEKCQVGISYAIGKAEPVAVDIDTFGTGRVSEDKLRDAVMKVFNLRPAAIIETLKLRETHYADTSCYGHWNRNNTWETLDMEKELREEIHRNDD